MMPVMNPPMRKEIFLGARWAEIIGGADDIGRDVRRQRGDAEREHRDDQHDRILETRQHIDRIPDRSSVDDGRRRSDRDADERIERHRQRQAERLADDLVALRFGVAREIGNVQRERRPEADHAGQRREEKVQNLPASAGPRECRRLRKIGPKPPAVR